MSLDNQHDPATAVSTALRDLAHENPTLDNPERVYSTLGDLLSSARTFSHVLNQLGQTLRTHGGRARDDVGDASVGGRELASASAALSRAADFLFQAECALDIASQRAGRIAWQPREPQHRWISVAFLQGAEADDVLDLIHRKGELAAIEHLRGWDFGDETTDAALLNGYVYDAVPHGVSDRVIADDDSGYALIYSTTLGHVALLRQHPPLPDVESSAESEPAVTAANDRARATDPRRWFDRSSGVARAPGSAVSR